MRIPVITNLANMEIEAARKLFKDHNIWSFPRLSYLLTVTVLIGLISETKQVWY